MLQQSRGSSSNHFEALWFIVNCLPVGMALAAKADFFLLLVKGQVSSQASERLLFNLEIVSNNLDSSKVSGSSANLPSYDECVWFGITQVFIFLVFGSSID